MSKVLASIVAVAAITLAAPLAAQMHEGGRGGGGHGGPSGGWGGGGVGHGNTSSGGHGSPHHFEFHGRSFGTLRPEERTHWASGEWRHVLHNGVFGWWWFLDDDWFYYPDAIYPYPTYVAPLLTAQETPVPPPSQPFWYYCANPGGYYPYVPACPMGWQMVPAVPADAPEGAPPPPVPAP